MHSPLVIHIPHASVAISEHDRKDILLNDSELNSELVRLTDRYTDELFAENWVPQNVIQFQHSRLVVDVERFESDQKEPCAAIGMGAVYLKTSEGKPLRNDSQSRREELIQNYYRPHHQLFDESVRRVLSQFKRCVIIDGHSYPTKPLPTQKSNSATPEIGIGTDPRFTPHGLIELTENYFRSQGFEVGLNTPFEGTFVPNEIYETEDKRVQSVMIEIRRDLYMDESTAEKNSAV
jgi:N-formylglutamate amidohydrolase